MCFEWGLTYNELAAQMENDEIAQFERNAVMVTNNTATGRVLSERITKKFDKMYSQKAFVHWYVKEGMEQSKLAEAREDLACMEYDYWCVAGEYDTDYSSDDD